MNENCIRDLKLTTDEIRKLGDAFSDTKFRQLFGQYLREIKDPDNRLLIHEQIVQLERECGNDVQLLEPVPGYVLKTSADGSKKVYVNICSNKNVGSPEYGPAIENNGVPGRNIFLPHAVLPVQNVCDQRNDQVDAYTVVFHPETLEKISSDNRIKEFVNETALTVVEKSFDVCLDKLNFRVSKKPFKGIAQLTTIRKSDANVAGPIRELKDCKDCDTPCIPQDSNEYVTPVHRIKYRNEVDLQDSTMDRFCKLNALLPKEMIIEIELPLLKSIQHTQLDVQTNSVKLHNEKPNYELFLNLPYEVNPLDGAAKFDADTRVLRLELKVRRKAPPSSAADEPKPINLVNGTSDQRTANSNDLPADEVKCSTSEGGSRPSTSSDESSDFGFASEKSIGSRFLDANVKYKLPAFDCNRLHHKLAFTMHVKNVSPGSFDYEIFDKRDGFWVKFCSLGGGCFPMFFAVCVVFEAGVEAVVSLEHSVEDEKVFVYVKLKNDFSPLEYWVGVNRQSLEKHYLNEPDAVAIEAEDKKMEALEVELGVSKFAPDEVAIDVSLRPDCQPRVPRSLRPCGRGAANGAPLVFETFGRFERLKSRAAAEMRQAQLERLEFETTAEELAPQTASFAQFCDEFGARFSLDEDAHCLSESELLPSRTSAGAAGKAGAAALSNGSWIAESKNAKKARRQKKARDKKMTAGGRQGGGAVGGGESETELTDSSKGVDDLEAHGGAADVKSVYKFSDLTSRSILKKHRSFSESSGDELCSVDCSRSYSINDIDFSSDSYSQSVPKKSVRFNDVILKKLYSSEISILEQRKRSKRRCQRKERKASDSDNSETETSASMSSKQEAIRLYNENLFGGENSDLELTSLSESGGETSDDQSDNPDAEPTKLRDVPCSKKNHKKRGKKSARKNASTAKHQYHID